MHKVYRCLFGTLSAFRYKNKTRQNVIPYGRQTIDESDIQAVVEILRGDFLTTGPTVELFERSLCDSVGMRYAVAVSSGTAALHLAALALLRHGDRVLTTPNSFVATANSILYAGAKPIFVDIDDSGNIDLDECERICESGGIMALFGVHFGGKPLDAQRLRRLKQRFGIAIVEDACHALGAQTVGEAGDAVVLSFHPVKHITTGEGGAVLTNCEETAKKLRSLRSHGIERGAADLVHKKAAFDENGFQNPWYYEMQDLGFNYRLTDIQSALGLSQLKKLPSFVARRRLIAQRYCEAFDGTPVLPLHPFDERGSYHLFVVLIDFSSLGISRAQFMKNLHSKGVGSQVHYIPIPMQPYYERLGYDMHDLQSSAAYYEKCLSLPIYPSMSDEEQQAVIDAVLHETARG